MITVKIKIIITYDADKRQIYIKVILTISTLTRS